MFFMCLNSPLNGILVQRPESICNVLAEPPLVDCEKPDIMGHMVDLSFQVNVDLIIKSGRIWRPGSQGRIQEGLGVGEIESEFGKGSDLII